MSEIFFIISILVFLIWLMVGISNYSWEYGGKYGKIKFNKLTNKQKWFILITSGPFAWLMAGYNYIFDKLGEK